MAFLQFWLKCMYNYVFDCYQGKIDNWIKICVFIFTAGLYNQCMLENHLLSDTRRLLEHLRYV